MAALVVTGVCAPPVYEALTLLEREALINAVKASRR
nr:MAG TPA: fatty acid metabolism regulator protein [Caudoviricetes sp.]